MPEPTNRIASLDGLRGIAALVVLVHHSLLSNSTLAAGYYGEDVPGTTARILLYTPLHLFWAGGEAVFVFFVLSGFVLTLPALRRNVAWRAYYPTRLLRLYLPVVAAVAFAAIVALLVPRTSAVDHGPWIQEHQRLFGMRDYLMNASLVSTNSLNSVLWSLRWEVLFSLALPAYIFTARRLKRYWWVGGLAAVGAATTAQALSFESLIFMPVFLLGSSIAAGWNTIGAVNNRMGTLITAASCVGLTASWWLTTLPGLTTSISLPLVLLSSGFIVIIAGRWAPAVDLLKHPSIQWLGRISFSLYLVHEPIVVSIAVILPPTLAWLTFFISAPLALIVAVMFSRWVELPAHRLAKAVGQRVSRSAAKAPTSEGLA